jgi:hypothetical protein
MVLEWINVVSTIFFTYGSNLTYPVVRLHMFLPNVKTGRTTLTHSPSITHTDSDILAGMSSVIAGGCHLI